VLLAIPDELNNHFSKGHNTILVKAKAFAKRQGLDWNELSSERKMGILASTAHRTRLGKRDGKTTRECWRDQAAELGWTYSPVIDEVEHEQLSDAERYNRAYAFAARHLAEEFRTAAQIDHDKLGMWAARGLIGTGIKGPEDIDEVVKLIEERGLEIDGKRVALVTGVVGDKVRVAHTEQIRIERKLGELAAAAVRDKSGALSAAEIRAAIEASGLDFSGEHGAAQKAAIYALGQGGALSLVQGPAGAGKTTLLIPLAAAHKRRGREVIGLSTAWRQADALKDADVGRTFALSPFLHAVARGDVRLSRDTVLVVDECSQIGPRSMLKLLELRQQTGCIINGLVGREQCQAIEAGDSVEVMSRVLPPEAIFELKSSVRQKTREGREVAELFRTAQAEEALNRKRKAGTAQLIGGDYDQVVSRIADFYLQRRDVLAAARSKKGVTVSALTNADAAAISSAVRERLKARGEIGADDVTYLAIDQRGERYELALAAGDQVRLFRRTRALIDGRWGSIGNNGDIVTVLGRNDAGLLLRNRDGKVGHAEWAQLIDERSGRLLLGFGHCLTVDAAQGITSAEHINALPRGTAGVTAFKAYTAESRHEHACFTMISEAAMLEAVREARPLGDPEPITADDLWGQAAEDMSQQPWKAIAIDLLDSIRADHEHAIDSWIRSDHRVQSQQLAGRNHAAEIHARQDENAAIAAMAGQMDALGKAIRVNVEATQELAGKLPGTLEHLRAAIIAARQAPQPKLAPRPQPPPDPPPEPWTYSAPGPGF
jgi:hypothetical protein